MNEHERIRVYKDMYRTMLRIREFEERIADYITKKEIITPCHLYIGQEAVAAGACAALTENDWIFSTHRSHGHYLAKGGEMNSLMAEIFTKETGCAKGMGGSMHVASPEKGCPGSSAIVAGSIPIAAGVALAFQLQQKKDVCAVFFGDGATNEGGFYETLNLAVLKKLPLIFICENNLYATHMPIGDILANPKIYRLVRSFGIASSRIDGNDAKSVFKSVSSAVRRARQGKGPSFIECMTYRWRGHVGPNDDIDKGLRNREELLYWIDHCPIKKFEEFLLENNSMTLSEMKTIRQQIMKEVDSAIRFAKNSPSPRMDRDCLELSVFKGT